MRWAAVLAVTVVLAAGCSPAHHAVAHQAAASSPDPLAAVLDAITPPSDAVQVPVSPVGVPSQGAYAYPDNRAGYRQLDRYWTTIDTPLEALRAVTAHPPAGLSGPPTGYPTDDQATESAQYDGTETAALDGPHVFVQAVTMSSGKTAIAAHVWETVKPAKPASERVAGTVSSVDASISVFQSIKPMLSSVSGAKAQQLATDLNQLWVDVGPEDAGCGGSIYTATSFDLTFHASGGDRQFSTGCLTIEPPGQTTAPNLWESPALVADLQADFGTLLPAPLQADGYGPAAPTPPHSSALLALLDRLTPPAGAKQTSLPDDIESSATGYTTQPGYTQAARAWTTTLTPDQAIAALAAHVPPGLTGGVEPPEPQKGPPQASASYRAVDTATRLGPRLMLEAEQGTAGVTTLSALVWQIDTTAKPVRDLVGAAVTSVTGTYTGGSDPPLTVSGARAQQLADDLNALLVNGSTLPPGCDAATTALTLTFQTAAGQQSFSDSCGFVRVLPALGSDPELETSDAFNLAVNALFGSLVPSPLPSSAPLPTSPALQTAGKTPDEVIDGEITKVTIETILPVGKGKQRETDQTFTLVGDLASRIVDDLRSTQVYTGPAPAGCIAEDRTSTIRVTVAGKRLTFVAFCVNVTTGTPNDPTLTLPQSLQDHLDAAFANLTPARSVDPPKSSALVFSLATAGTLKDKVPHPIAGTVTVTQDGVTLGSKQLEAGERWRLPVRPGVYTVTSVAKGYTCGSGAITVPAGIIIGPGADCS